MLKLTFYGGVGEIGGNKILLEDNGTRIFLDFGKSFCAMEEYFAGYLAPRSVNGIGDYLEFDILPKLEGLYKKEVLEGNIIKRSKPKFDAVLISHPHIDHIGFLSFLDENIPVYCGEITKLIIDAIEESTSGGNFGSHIFNTFHTGDRLKIGSLEIEPIHVDHSTPGAYGYIIHTSIGAVVYTGDLRMHGTRKDMTEDFILKADKAKPAVLITEGTRVMPEDTRKNYTEEGVGREIKRIISESDKLILATFYGRDLDRFRTFHTIAKECNKKFVVSMKLAYLLNKVKKDPKFQIPDVLTDDTLLVYKRRKKSGEFEEKDYQKWERVFLDKAVTYEYVKKNQASVVFNLDLLNFQELIDIRPDAGSHFIHSMSEPFSEEDINDEVMHRWLEHFNLEFHQIHASGHCSGSEIKELISRINPQRQV
ncbi:MAG: MBL fold metallo-hydrolase [Candidatus Omnitrophica bacterium]|nr:MBL fold metallo-hydrolase [Candidatus Omnitrophota bacterium]